MTSQPLDPPRGFTAAAGASGIKKSGKPDLALLVSTVPATAAGVFTTNKVVAPPVRLTAERLRGGRCQAILVNSGNANACTGAAGMAAAERCSALTAEALGIDEHLLAIASTGVIGVPLPLAPFETHVPRLAAARDAAGFAAAAEAMRTTDAFAKLSGRTCELAGTSCRLLGLAKGAGMIHPNMATMLAFVLTDAAISKELADLALRRAVEGSFNRITVDRDTSTNDMALLLANGAAGGAELGPDHPAAEVFVASLTEVLLDLAKMIVRDGEGATKLVRIQVEGARSDADALLVARSIATSQLVKTAFFGEDANWGRIIAAAGYAGAELDPDRVGIRFDEVAMVENGLGLGAEQEARATVVMQQAEFTVSVNLGLGAGTAFYLTSDLGYEYVRINADYRT